MKKITIEIPTGNWFGDADGGELEIGRCINIEYADTKDLMEQLDDLSEDDYREGLIDKMPIGDWIEKMCKENAREITLDKIAGYLAKYPVAEYEELRGNNMLKYNLYVKFGELVPPHESDGADRLIAWRDVEEYMEDDTPERITATETLEDGSFKDLCEDFMSQIRGRG